SLALLYPFLNVGIDALRWQLLLRAISRPIAWSKLVRVNLVGMFFDNFLPASIASDAYRTVCVSQQYISHEVLATVLLGRVLSWVGLTISALLGLLALQNQLPPHILWSGLLALGGGLCAITFGFGLLIILQRWHTYSWYHRLLLKWEYLALFIKSINQLLTCRTMLMSLSLSWLLHAVVIAAVVVIAKAYGVLSEQLFSVACVAPLGIVAYMLPIAIAGHGIREIAFIYFLAYLGIMPEVALAISLSLYATSIIASLIGGGVYIFGTVVHRKQNKHLST
ncbi:MAG TPA: lysylphosphatidylglycerol synthase transmembrane domain-containing protein, partial [Candidatus Saccharimonadales bacterium]|nr:lysylphosphatidylglycerol synthase transmembrane domain-containing protein [Candidatus Saccharimonadales bacterium]